MSNRFNILDLHHLYDVIHTLRVTTVPLNEHTDPLSTEDCWNQVYDLLDKMATTYKEQMYDKETIESMIGKKIHKYEKRYDENGILTEIVVQPVSVVEYIELTMTIQPTSDSIEL
jgi:hypothetical protein